MRLQGGIFDMDGTLLDSMSVWKSQGSGLLRRRGIEPEPGLDGKLRPLSLLDAVGYCREHYGLPETPEELAAEVNAQVDSFYRSEVRAKPGAEKFLSILKMEGVEMYIATATDRDQVEAALRHTDLLRYFQGILTCTEMGCGKESPRIFEKALTRLRCRKQDAVVFEDALHAVRTAKEAGFRVAAVYEPMFEADQPELRRLADYYIRSFEEFVQTEG